MFSDSETCDDIRQVAESSGEFYWPEQNNNIEQ